MGIFEWLGFGKKPTAEDWARELDEKVRQGLGTSYLGYCYARGEMLEEIAKSLEIFASPRREESKLPLMTAALSIARNKCSDMISKLKSVERLAGKAEKTELESAAANAARQYEEKVLSILKSATSTDFRKTLEELRTAAEEVNRTFGKIDSDFVDAVDRARPKA